jgi:DNA segregation ATPase FtsK/SpoIIIE-like protein
MARHEQIPKYAAILGFSEDGSTSLHRFDSQETPHLLIAGGPNAGKTVMLRSIAASLALNNRQSEIQIAAICPTTGNEDRQRAHASSWYILNYLPHMLCDIAFKHSDIVDLLTFLKNEISYREKYSFKHPRLIVLIDQVDILISHGGARCAEPILHLAQKGDEVGIHLVLSAQSAGSHSLSTQLLKELPTRLLGRPPIKETEQNSTLKREEDVEQLLGEGDFLHQENGRVKRLQGAFIGDKQLIPKLIDMNRHRAILLASPAQTRLRLDEAPAEPGANLSINKTNLIKAR